MSPVAQRRLACKASTKDSSSAMALVECGTLCVERIERMPAANIVATSCFRKQCVRDDGVDRGRAGGGERLGAGDHRAAGRNDVVDEQGGAACNALSDPEIRSPPSDRRGGSSSQRYVTAEPAGEVADPGPRFRIRADHDRSPDQAGLAQRVGDGRHGREIVGLDAGKYVADVRRCDADGHRR